MIVESGTNFPSSINFLASNPIAVPSFIAALRISPVDIWGIPYFSIKNLAWVPFPAPGAPNNMIFIMLSSP